MQSNWRIGSLFGIPLLIDSSWFFILVFVSFINAREFYSEWGLWIASGAGLVMALLLFSSVLLHELGHSLVARSQGINVSSITLFIFGGIASIEQESKTPGQAFQVAVAGPAVSLTLFGLFSLVSTLIDQSSIFFVLARDLASINLVLTIFNLLPGLPLDGGQILKAAVWKLTGNRFSGVRWAGTVGQVFAWLFIALGVFLFIKTGQLSAIWVVLISGFILRNASSYQKIANLQEALIQVLAAEAMTRNFRVVDAEMTLRQFAEEYILADVRTSDPNHQVYPYYAASQGRYLGLVSVEDLNIIERSLWDTQPLQSIVRSLDQIVTVEEKSNLAEVINTLDQHDLRRITVLSPAGTVAGVIDKGDIVRAIAPKINLPIPEAEIKRIKSEASYPQYLPLPAIAKSAVV